MVRGYLQISWCKYRFKSTEIHIAIHKINLDIKFGHKIVICAHCIFSNMDLTQLKSVCKLYYEIGIAITLYGAEAKVKPNFPS